MLKNSSCYLPQFPRRHQYTWPRVEAQTHPLQTECINLEFPSHARTNLPREMAVEGQNNNLEICKQIADVCQIYSGRYLADGEWKWLNENRRAAYLAALHASDIDALLQIYSSLFRQDASYGIVSGTYTEFCDTTQNLSIINGILCDVDTWLDYTNLSPEQYLAMPDIGMPYGIQFGDNLVSPDICRHDYHAGKIFRLIEDMGLSRATVLEIGGGYGGAAYQFLKRDSSKKHCWVIVDLFETLCVQYYWLSSCGITVDFAIDGSLKQSSSQVILVPSDMAEKIDVGADVVYNCNSFSEMAYVTVANYFDLVNNKWKPRYIFHQNSDVLLYPNSPRHVEVVSSQFPIDNAYKEIYRTLSPWAGGSGRYREYLYERASFV